MIDVLISGLSRLSTLATQIPPGLAGSEGAAGAAGGSEAVTNGYDIGNNITSGYYASAAEGGGMGGLVFPVLLWGGAFILIYLVMMRPHKKREKKLKELQAGIKTGDNIVTNSGLFGRIADVGTDCFVVEMGIGGRTVKLPILKSEVLGVRDPVLTPPPKDSVES